MKTTKRIAIIFAGLMIAGCANDADQVKSSAELQQEVEPSPLGQAARPAAAPMEEEEAVESVQPMEMPAAQAQGASEPRVERKSRRAKRKPAPGRAKREDAPSRRRGPHARPTPSKAPKLDDTLASAPSDDRGLALDTSGAEEYENYGVNEMTDSSKDRLSTFSIDVDTGSYTVARKKLDGGQIPPAAAVRVEEFVNYFHYDYPSPDDGAFGVHLEAAPSPFTAEEDTYLLRVGVQGKKLARQERKPVHLTFLVDVSGSMNRPDKLHLAQKSLKILTNNLQAGDTVALATYAGRVAKILDPTGIHQKGRILEAIDNLRSGGGTGMSNGMELAYQLALQNFKRNHVNRVIVLSDGDANIGPSSHEEIQNRIRHYVEEGVTLSTIGFGMGNYKDTMMEQLANKGNGNYYYIDTEKEARKVFGEQLDGTLQVIAKDVKIQVDFDPAAIPSYRLIGYENRDIADKDFRNDRVDAGEIGAGHTVTALYEVKLNRQARGKLATVRIRAKKPDGYKAQEQAFHFRDSDVRRSLSDASRDFQFAGAVAMFAEILRESPYAKHVSLALVEEVAKSASSRNQADRQEFLKLVAKAKRMKG